MVMGLRVIHSFPVTNTPQLTSFALPKLLDNFQETSQACFSCYYGNWCFLPCLYPPHV